MRQLTWQTANKKYHQQKKIVLIIQASIEACIILDHHINFWHIRTALLHQYLYGFRGLLTQNGLLVTD